MFECPNCGAEMYQVERIEISASMDGDDEDLSVDDGQSRIDLVCEECGYEERGETRGIEVNTNEDDKEIDEEDPEG